MSAIITPAMVRRHAGTILVVDDSEDHRMLAQRRLSDAGWNVRVAGTAEEALAGLDGVDLMLLDYRLPGLSGLEVLLEIRRRGGPSVVMVTGMGSEGLAVEAMRAGALDYVTKDSSYLEDLPHTVERAWRHHDLSRRAGELQRLALLVTAAADRDSTLAAIAEGACLVLRADACVLHVASEDAIVTAGDPASAIGDQVLVPIKGTDGEFLGTLAVLTEEPADYSEEELGLAETFAAFAGIALANLRRLELEQRLVTELEVVLDARREFVAHVSHELRTPLTCIEGFTHTLVSHGDKLSDAERAMFLTKISEHGAELHRLVESLLDYAAVESGRTAVQPTTLYLGVELSEVLSGLGPLLAGRPVTFSPASTAVWADPVLLRRAFTNLIANAAKYSRPDAAISVLVEVGDGVARVEVADEGPGIEAADLPHVFEPFWRGRTVVQGALRGTGLGLSLVREYSRLLGGDVGATSVPGSGSRFWFTVPLSP